MGSLENTIITTAVVGAAAMPLLSQTAEASGFRSLDEQKQDTDTSDVSNDNSEEYQNELTNNEGDNERATPKPDEGAETTTDDVTGVEVETANDSIYRPGSDFFRRNNDFRGSVEGVAELYESGNSTAFGLGVGMTYGDSLRLNFQCPLGWQFDGSSEGNESLDGFFFSPSLSGLYGGRVGDVYLLGQLGLGAEFLDLSNQMELDARNMRIIAGFGLGFDKSLFKVSGKFGIPMTYEGTISGVDVNGDYNSNEFNLFYAQGFGGNVGLEFEAEYADTILKNLMENKQWAFTLMVPIKPEDNFILRPYLGVRNVAVNYPITGEENNNWYVNFGARGAWRIPGTSVVVTGRLGYDADNDFEAAAGFAVNFGRD